MTKILETNSLCKSYGSFRALDQVDLSLNPGTIGLLGPNGAGKSTLIKCLLQLHDKTSGSASILGLDIDMHGRETRRHVGYAPEQDCHIPGMAGCEYVTYCAQLSGLPFAAARQRAHEMLDFVGMEQERYRKVDTYSTGMKQRVKIAQALVHDPKIVFLDEPTNGLDPKGQRRILDLIGRIWKESAISVVLSSHLLHDIDRICEQIVIVSQGRVLVQDTLAALKSRRRPEAEIALSQGQEQAIEAFGKRGWACRRLANGNLSVTHGEANVSALIELLREINVVPQEIKASPNALNELFVQALQEAESSHAIAG